MIMVLSPDYNSTHGSFWNKVKQLETDKQCAGSTDRRGPKVRLLGNEATFVTKHAFDLMERELPPPLADTFA